MPLTTSVERDAALEHAIDAIYTAMIGAPTEAKSQDLLTELSVLIRRRSPHQVLKFELERRAFPLLDGDEA